MTYLFFILKKELSERKNQGFEFGKIDENAIKKLENYEKTLSEKMKKLRLNEFEIGFIENFA